MKRINVKDWRDRIFQIHRIPFLNQKMRFYYDETGNCRKFSLRSDGTVNSTDAIYHDFILGGIAVAEDFNGTAIDEFYQTLHLQSNHRELKYKHLQSQSGNFIDTIGSHKTTALLNWLVEKPIYIHFSVINNLYYALTDIVDSLYGTHEEAVTEMNQALKSSLYQFCKQHQDEVFSLFVTYHYPGISREDSKAFCQDFSDLIQCYNDDSTMEGFYLETVRQMLKCAGGQQELVFLYDNQPNKLIDEYYILYFERCMLFPHSYHVFDEEPVIQAHINEIDSTYNGAPLHNYEFQNSINNKFLQISDAFVGLLGGLFYYIDNLTNRDVKSFFDGTHKQQIENIGKIRILIDRSSRFSPYLIKNINDNTLMRDRERKLSFLSYG